VESDEPPGVDEDPTAIPRVASPFGFPVAYREIVEREVTTSRNFEDTEGQYGDAGNSRTIAVDGDGTSDHWQSVSAVKANIVGEEEPIGASRRQGYDAAAGTIGVVDRCDEAGDVSAGHVNISVRHRYQTHSEGYKRCHDHAIQS